LVGDIDLGVSLDADLLGGLQGGDDDPADTDLTVETPLTDLDVNLDAVEELVGDIDIDIDVVLNQGLTSTIEIDADLLDALHGGAQEVQPDATVDASVEVIVEMGVSFGSVQGAPNELGDPIGDVATGLTDLGDGGVLDAPSGLFG
jgi:hypothetical protein